ncbi:hypothetical protein L218DRAFT_1002867 [Marasmius fiardii PR-910]|nr:hypothetical protein L218DRAFT_1002867 [Marasmius fiardii PR-910]
MSTITSLPVELLEYILVTCGFLNDPLSIANLSRTCRFLRDTIYHTSDRHLWREIYLTTFDDPRPVLRTLGQVEGCDDEEFDWKTAYQDRVRAVKLFRKMRPGQVNSGLEPVYLKQSINALLDDVKTASLHLGTLGEVNVDPPAATTKRRDMCISPHLKLDSDSCNVSWLSKLVLDGFPEVLIHHLIGRSPTGKDVDSYIPLYEKLILNDKWELTEEGRAFHRLVLQTGFQPMTMTFADNAEGPGSPYNLRSYAKKKELTDPISESDQRSLARNIARHRVYNLRYLSETRCWGPYLPLIPTKSPVEPESSSSSNSQATDDTSNLAESGDFSLPFIRAVLSDFNIVLENHLLFGDIVDLDGGDDDGDFVPSQNDSEDSDSEAVIVPFEEHEHEHEQHSSGRNTDNSHHVEDQGEGDEEEEHGEDSDEDSMSSSLLATFHVSSTEVTESEGGLHVAPLSVPIFPSEPHLLKPDYVYLSAARTVVEENLRDRYGHRIDQEGLWPWFTSMEALDSTRVILERVRSLDGLRMGGAPGFWNGDGVASPRGWVRKDVEEEGDEESGAKKEGKGEAKAKSKPVKTMEGEEECDGWDWAGVAGKWMRAVAWMDYRDLLFHNVRTLRTPNPLTAGSRTHESDIQETIRVFPMNIKITGYSRVQPPKSLPSAGSSTSTSTSTFAASSSSSQPRKDPEGKGKGKAREEDLADDPHDHDTKLSPSPLADEYDPLIYALPVIHIFGEYRGSDVDENARRACRGTVRMIGDRAVRWTLVSRWFCFLLLLSVMTSDRLLICYAVLNS